MAVGAIAQLPAVMRRLVPELDRLDWWEESRADCARCPMVPARSGAAPERPWAFDAEVRCCTYHPALPSFLAGAALHRGGGGAAAVRARLADPAGVSAWGIYPPEPLARRYRETREGGFGRDPGMRCPYFAGGELSCGIWPDRPGVCRTWFCRHDHGLAGALVWSALERALWQVENRLAFRLIEVGRPPADGATAVAWEAWYRWCAQRADAVDDGDLAALASAELDAARGELRRLHAARRRPLPARLVPAVGEVTPQGDQVRLSGYSSFDAVVAPRAVFELLAALDGTRPWREVNAGLATPVDEALVAELHRIGAVDDAPDGDQNQ